MAKKIEWLDSFAENYAKDIKKTASKVQKEDIIVDKNDVKGAKLGDVINFQGKLYKVADLNFEDEKGPGVVLNEVGPDVPTSDPMSMSMGTEVSGLTNGKSSQEYARTNPGDVYHYETRDDVEQSAFEQSATETAQQIEKERASDRSTVPGHYTAPTNIEESTAPVETPVETLVEETPVEEIPVETSVEETPIEITVEETPVETLVEGALVDETPIKEDDSKEEENDLEDDSEDEEKSTDTRHNRILRRIMASK